MGRGKEVYSIVSIQPCMRKLLFTTLYCLLFCNASAQYLHDVPPPAVQEANWHYHPWWTLYASGAIVPNDVRIGNPGIGWGTALLFPLNGKVPDWQSPVWLGLDFNYHYFGTEQLGSLYVHYENWQLAFTTRITGTDKRKTKPFMDVQLGGRYLVGLTSDGRNYSGIILRRAWDGTATALNLGGLTATDYNIVREYGKMSLMGTLAPGVQFIGKRQHWSGVFIKCFLQFGTNTHYLNRDSLHVAQNPLLMPPQKGSGLMYGLQLGLTI